MYGQKVVAALMLRKIGRTQSAIIRTLTAIIPRRHQQSRGTIRDRSLLLFEEGLSYVEDVLREV